MDQRVPMLPSINRNGIDIQFIQTLVWHDGCVQSKQSFVTDIILHVCYTVQSSLVSKDHILQNFMYNFWSRIIL